MKSKAIKFLQTKNVFYTPDGKFEATDEFGESLVADALEEYAQQSQPSGMRWVDDVNKIRGQAKAFGDKYSGSISEQAAAEVGFNAAINQVINILSEPSPAGAAEGASEGISKIREVMNWISQCVDEDHDLEVSEIKMIWNDLSDAISLIESTPHSSEGMAEALAKFFAKECKVGDPLLSIIDSIYDDWKLVYDKLRIETSFSEAAIQANKFVIEKYASLSPGVEDGSGWVKVETPPNDGVYVLLHGKGGRNFTALYKQGEFLAYNPFNEELDLCEEVTHWRPLPTPPDVEDKANGK